MEMNRMKKIVYSTLFFAGMFLTTACSDYLEVGSPSIVDSDFVFSNPTTARAALDGAYEQWRIVRRIRFLVMDCFMLLILPGLI